MNCEDFNRIIDDLADDKPMSATVRDAGVSHSALCPGCAVKLADARAVAGYLLAAARAESEQAPINVKQNLLAAFADVQKHQSTPARVVDISSRRRRRSWVAAAAAVAAVILLAIGLSIWRKAPLPGPQPDLQASAPSTPVTLSVNDSKNDSTPGSSLVKKKSSDREFELNANTNSGPHKAKRITPESGRSPQTSETVARNTGHYLPLTYLAKGTEIDSGTVVRVELSRAALASFGFGGGVESSAESVRADVILGDDGVVRAIRLVE
jgi:hypothetical protein